MPAEPDFNHAVRRAVEHAGGPRIVPIESRVAVNASPSGLRGLLILIAAAIVIGGWMTTPAVAHGPCRCLDPRLAEAGSPVRIAFEIEVGLTTGRGYPAYRVVFNPHPSDLGIAPRLLASAYRADVATTTVLSRPHDRPTRRARFRVPAGTPPGVYLVLIFDGNEGGAHNTWEYLHVIDADRETAGVVARPRTPAVPAATDATQRDSSSPWSVAWPAAVASFALALIVVGTRLHRRRRRPHT